MNAQELEIRLRRIEGLLSMLVDHHSRELTKELRASYRAGYQMGRIAVKKGLPDDPDGVTARSKRFKYASEAA